MINRDSLEVIHALDDVGEKKHICSMCQTKKSCPKERKEAFMRDFKARSCPHFTYPRARADEKWRMY